MLTPLEGTKSGRNAITLGAIVGVVFVTATLVSIYSNTLTIRKTKLEIARLEDELEKKNIDTNISD